MQSRNPSQPRSATYKLASATSQLATSQLVTYAIPHSIAAHRIQGAWLSLCWDTGCQQQGLAFAFIGWELG
eukprot:scaffold30694_cov18-Tisochrysis_lutea.AAC.3